MRDTAKSSGLTVVRTLVLVAAVGGMGTFAAYEHLRLGERNRVLEQEQALLAAEIRQLRSERDESANKPVELTDEMQSNSNAPLSDEQFRELLRLRGTVGLLREQIADANKRLTLEQSLHKMLEARLAYKYQAGLTWDAAGRLLKLAGEQTNLTALKSGRATINALGDQKPGTNAAPGAGATPGPEDSASALDEPQALANPLEAGLAAWAAQDTEAALAWVDQEVSDPGQKDAAIQAIRSVAPVGIGAELAQKDGHTVINGLIPGSVADLSGQIHPGDQILGVAQGDGAFVDTANLALKDLVQQIRGDPGSVIQLQILPAGAAPGSPPVTVTLTRDQIKFKQ